MKDKTHIHFLLQKGTIISTIVISFILFFGLWISYQLLQSYNIIVEHHIYVKELNYRIRLLILFMFFSTGIVFVFLVINQLRKRNYILQEKLNSIKTEDEYAEELSLAAAGLAHETKNPLGIIRGLAQQISKNKDISEDVKMKSIEIMNEADITVSRLGDFINYAKIRTPNLIHINILDLTTRITGLFLQDFEDAGVKLNLDVQSSNILADEDMLSQILVNLLMNSLKFTEAGGEVSIKLEKVRKNKVTLSVIDSGEGMSNDMLQKVFKPYLGKSKTGYGIGLAIVKRIIDLSGWKIDVKSQEGTGTQFIISEIDV